MKTVKATPTEVVEFVFGAAVGVTAAQFRQPYFRFDVDTSEFLTTDAAKKIPECLKFLRGKPVGYDHWIEPLRQAARAGYYNGIIEDNLVPYTVIFLNDWTAVEFPDHDQKQPWNIEFSKSWRKQIMDWSEPNERIFTNMRRFVMFGDMWNV